VSRIAAARLEPLYDSRGERTVEATIALDSGAEARAGAPSGASTGRHEVRAFPAGGVPEALLVFRDRVAPALVGLEVPGIAAVDGVLHAVDGTPDLARIGGNTATAVSVAAAMALAAERREPLWKFLERPNRGPLRYPSIVGNCLNGGKHAIGGPDIQEFIAFVEERDPADSVRAALRVHHLLRDELERRYPGRALGRGDEGGWVAAIGNLEALEILAGACATARDETHLAVHPGIDLAASEFYRDGQYRYRDRTLDEDGQVAFVAELVDRYGIRYLEDPLDEEAFSGFAAMTRAVGDRTLVIGDDLYVTNVARLDRGIAERSSNAVLIKVNQVGTITDTLQTVDRARAAGLASIASHRSGEVPEGWLAHVALGIDARGLKCGVLGGERVAKLNELLRLARATGT